MLSSDESNISLHCKILQIEPPDNDYPAGVVDVRFWVGDEESTDVRGTAEVRVYFTDQNMTVSQIDVEARVVALDILSKIIELDKTEMSLENIKERWK